MQRLDESTSELERLDRCGDLPHRPRVLLGKMGLDGHDRGVKIIARAMRDSGVHVIYSGLWQTPESLAISARDEDADVLAVSTMSNSHNTLAPRLIEALGRVGRPDLPVHLGGILPAEDIAGLVSAGVSRCFATGTGLLDVVEAVRGAVSARPAAVPSTHAVAQLARDISLVQSGVSPRPNAAMRRPARVIGVTGAPGAGKSTLVARLAGEYSRRAESDASLGRCAVVAFDPQSPITSGALLGDRLRVDFNSLGERVFYRSLAIRGEDYGDLDRVVDLIGGVGVEAGAPVPLRTVFVETVGAGQNEVRIRDHVDRTAVVLTPGMGDSVQMDKAGILEIADLFVCNKADHAGEDALVRDLGEVSRGRPIVETVATHGRGIAELLDELL